MSIIKFVKSDIENDIKKITASERVTKATLSKLSRELLAYVYETNDVGMVTRLIQVLTPVNKRVAMIYFPHFLGWSFNEKDCTFGTKLKDKVHTKKYEAACEFLQDEANDIWVYAAKEIELGKKPKAYAAKFTKLATQALKDEEEGIEVKDILFAIMASELVTLQDLLAPLAELTQDKGE